MASSLYKEFYAGALKKAATRVALDEMLDVVSSSSNPDCAGVVAEFIDPKPAGVTAGEAKQRVKAALLKQRAEDEILLQDWFDVVDQAVRDRADAGQTWVSFRVVGGGGNSKRSLALEWSSNYCFVPVPGGKPQITFQLLERDEIVDRLWERAQENGFSGGMWESGPQGARLVPGLRICWAEEDASSEEDFVQSARQETQNLGQLDDEVQLENPINVTGMPFW